MAMRRRGHDEALIDRVVFENPAAFLGQSPKFTLGAPNGNGAPRAMPRAEADAVATV
jgi:hypothetical protein